MVRVLPRQVDVSELVTPEEYQQLFQEANNAVDAVTLPDHLKNDWLAVPLSYFRVFLGETFSFYIIGTNDSTMEAMVDVSIRIDMQIGNTATFLKELKLDRLEAKMNLDSLFAYEIKEASTHMLICTIGFTLGSEATGSERQMARKYFQFPISKPLDVRTKSYCPELDEDATHLEVIFQNLTNWPMQLTSVQLESNHYDVASLNYTMEEDETKRHLIFGRRNRLASNESRQYLFAMKPKEPYRYNVEASQQINTLGKLEIVWLTAIGQRGHIQTSHLEKSNSSNQDIKIQIEGLPDIAHLHKVFKARLHVVNCSRKMLKPIICLDNTKTADLLWLGPTRRTLAELKPTEDITEEVCLYPTARGTYNVPRFAVTVNKIRTEFDFNKHAVVKVV